MNEESDLGSQMLRFAQHDSAEGTRVGLSGSVSCADEGGQEDMAESVGGQVVEILLGEIQSESAFEVLYPPFELGLVERG